MGNLNELMCNEEKLGGPVRRDSKFGGSELWLKIAN